MQDSIDFVWTQFYNNPACNLNSGSAFLSALQSWSSDLSGGSGNSSASVFRDVGTGVTSPRLFIGAPAFAAAGSGYDDTATFQTILQSVNNQSIGNLEGLVLWDGAYGEESGATGSSYMQIAKDVPK